MSHGDIGFNNPSNFNNPFQPRQTPQFSGGGQTGGGGFEALLAALQGGAGAGLFGLGDVATGGLLSGGTALLGGLSGLLQGESAAEKRQGKVFNLAQNRLGQDVLNPDQYLADFMRLQQERAGQVGERVNRQFGLDAGVGQSEFLRSTEPAIAQFMLQAKQQADVLKSQNDNALLSLMAGLSRG